MTLIIKEKSIFRSPLVVYTLAAAFVFTLGFFIHFGREAHNTKTWKQVMPYSDSALYWAVAKGRMMTPRCDGNPAYYEEQGTRHSICFFTAETLGLIAKYTGISLYWFFLAWHIFMPLGTWFVILLCCWKLWKYPLGVSAGASMVLLLSSMLFPWPVWEVLFRFSRPMDGIAPLFLWVSLIFKGDPHNEKHCWAMVFIAALALWLQPFYAVFGLWITVLEYCRISVSEKDFLKARLHMYAMGSVLVSGCFYLYRIFYGEGIVHNIGQRNFPLDGSLASCFVAALLFLVLFLVAVFFLGPFLKKSITALDRLVLEWASFGAIIYGAFGPQKQQVAAHMIYFFMIMIFSLAGWLYEKMVTFKETLYFSRLNTFCVIVAGTLFACNEKFLFLSQSHYYGYITRYFLVLIFFMGLLSGVDFLKRIAQRKGVVFAAMLLLATVGYARIPLNAANHNFPFVGVYEWFKQHARKNEVVLMATTNVGATGTLFFDTGLKPYSDLWGSDLSQRPSDVAYRYYFSNGLMLGLLSQVPAAENWSLDQKLHFLKLDYILIPLPSPFFDAIALQLQGRLTVVYQDKRCLLWRVS